MEMAAEKHGVKLGGTITHETKSKKAAKKYM